MNLRHHIDLIPRNNWDYGLPALSTALTGVSRKTAGSPFLKEFFQQEPVWTTSGRASLYAILKSLDLPTGAQVGVPLFCCSVVFNAVCQAGFKPRFIDSNLSDANISAGDVRKKRPDLAALVGVHMFGNPFDVDAVVEAADGLPVIEDCAQSIFSSYKGKPTGSLTTASFFSFRCGKYISAGEGSPIFSRDPMLQEAIARQVDNFEIWSSTQLITNAFSTFFKASLYNRPWYGLLGYPVGMALDKRFNLTAKDGFEAGKVAGTHLALVNSRLPQFRQKIELQQQHARLLLSLLEPGKFSLPVENENCCGNWYQFALRFQAMEQRDRMARFLLDRGIDTARYLDHIADEAREQYGYTGDCPNAELLSQTILLIPIHYTLQDRDIQHIARSINEGSKIL